MNAAVFQQALNSILKDNKYDREVARQRTGKLHTKGLHRAALSGRVFKKRIERLHKNYDCTLLVDCSGSMTEEAGNSGLAKYEIAIESAELLHKAMVTAGLPCRVVGFNTTMLEAAPFNQKKVNYGKMKKQLTRFSNSGYVQCYMVQTDKISDREDMQEYIERCAREGEKLSPFAYKWRCIEPFNSPKEHYAMENGDRRSVTKGKSCEQESAPGGNNDAWALAWVVEQALEQNKNAEHIVIVLSDGQPAYWRPEMLEYKDPLTKKWRTWNDDQAGKSRREGLIEELQRVVTHALKKGILFVGIGIDTEHVKEIYPKEFCSVVRAKAATEGVTKTKGNALFDAVTEQLRKHVKRG